MPDIQETLWDAVKSEIVDLSLSGLTSSTLRQQQIPANPSNGQITEGGFIYPVTEREGQNGTNVKDDVGYGFGVTLIKKSNGALAKDPMTDVQAWRRAITRHFSYQAPLRSSGCYTCNVEPGQAVIPEAWHNQVDATALIIRCWVLE